LGVSLATAAVALGAWRLMAMGARPVPAALMAALVVATGIWTTHASSAPSITLLPEVKRLGRVSLLFLLAVGAILVFAFLNPEVLKQSRPDILAGLALATLAAIGMATWGLRQLVFWIAASQAEGDTSPWRFAMRRQSSPRWMMINARREQQIEQAVLDGPPSGWWSRVARWRLGNPASQQATFIVVFAVIMFAMQWFMPRQGGGYQFGRTFLFMFAGFMSVMVLAQVGIKWRMRTMILPWEFCRPYSRPTMQTDLMAAFLVDVLPTAVISAAAGSIAVNLKPDFSVDWLSVPLDFALWLLAAGSLGAGISAMPVVFHRLWVAFVLGTVVVYATLMAAMGLAFWLTGLTQTAISGMSRAGIEISLLTCTAIGMLLCALMARTWIRLELGRRV
jgi:hypothetical protein